MNQRVIRTAQAVQRGQVTPEPRRALRTALPPAPEPSQARTPRRVERAAGTRQVNTSTHQGRSTVSETSRTDSLPHREFAASEERGEVRVGHGKTINVGNFESVRVDVHVTLPCTRATVRQVIEEAHDYVVEAIAAEQEYLLGTTMPTSQRQASRRG